MNLSVPRLGPGVAIEAVGSDVLAFDGKTLSHLGGSIAVVARSVDGLCTVRAIGHALAQSTGRGIEDLMPEVTNALDELVAHGLAVLDQVEHSHDVHCPEYVGWCEDGDRAVLVDLRNGDRHELDSVGARIWGFLVTLQSIAAVLEGVASAYPDTPGLADELSRFIADLVGRGLLKQA